METVKVLRQAGYSYQAIADQLRLSVNTVKSYCQRNGLGGIQSKEKPDIICLECHQVMEATNRKQRFCCNVCRQDWWNSHLDKVNRKAYYDFTCKQCGKDFQAYGDKDRIYCCHHCYILDRFGGDSYE